jgi:hypothetical protein
MVTINQTLEAIMQLDASSREMLIEILQKRQIDERRREIARHGQQSKRDFKNKKIAPQSAANIVSTLNAL